MAHDSEGTRQSREDIPAATVSKELESIQVDVEQPHSIYTRREIWVIVAIVATAGLFSPLPANIYFPAIPTLSSVFHESTEMLNLTVTVYLVMQGISPMLWGPLSDQFGRRPVFLVCIAILFLSCVGMALTPTSAFWLLLLLRCVQAAGCASTIALGAGVIGDISVPADRGGYFGMFNLGPMLAPNIGPAIGGALSQYLGWRSIFWFLAIFSAVCFLFIALILPETLRALVGNGSIRPSRIYRPLFPIVGRGRQISPAVTDEKPPRRPFINPFRLFAYPDVSISLLFTGIVYAVNYTITATISTSYASAYPFLSDTALGLCYLATGGGMILGSTLTGKFLDRDYQVIKQRTIRENDARDPEKRLAAVDVTKDVSFPIEVARLRTIPIQLGLFVACAIGWGWCLDKRVSIAGPLILQFALGYTSMAILNTTMTLMVDLLPSQSSSVIACTNFVRCSLAAILVSLIDKIMRALGVGWAYVLLAGICAGMLPLMLLEIKLGPKYRLKRHNASLP
ncbi:hypothetical protein PLICRDRAFT_96195 [Plicaturopsis crispa FD-325 SS-3]|nr:hypothetical protein PLICRDRAFT_96195 [Plicaturopsis crispa FD-325 SS-3]